MLLEMKDAVKQFGGITALSHMSFQVEEGGNLRNHRTKWCREDDHIQPDYRRLPGNFRRYCV